MSMVIEHIMMYSAMLYPSSIPFVQPITIGIPPFKYIIISFTEVSATVEHLCESAINFDANM